MLDRFFFSSSTHMKPLIWNLISLIPFPFQVSTSTGVVSHFVNVQVVVPEAFILGSGELHVDMGSAINLVCIIEKVSVLSGYYWLVLSLCGSLSHILCVHTFPPFIIARTAVYIYACIFHSSYLIHDNCTPML